MKKIPGSPAVLSPVYIVPEAANKVFPYYTLVFYHFTNLGHSNVTLYENILIHDLHRAGSCRFPL